MFARLRMLLVRWISPSPARTYDDCPFDPAELARLIRRGHHADFLHIARVLSARTAPPPAAPPPRRGGGRSRSKLPQPKLPQ